MRVFGKASREPAAFPLWDLSVRRWGPARRESRAISTLADSQSTGLDHSIVCHSRRCWRCGRRCGSPKISFLFTPVSQTGLLSFPSTTGSASVQGPADGAHPGASSRPWGGSEDKGIIPDLGPCPQENQQVTGRRVTGQQSIRVAKVARRGRVRSEICGGK